MAHIVIDRSGRCTCSCAGKCLFEKSGSAPRCTKEEIEDAGYNTLQVVKDLIGRVKVKDHTGQLTLF